MTVLGGLPGPRKGSAPLRRGWGENSSRYFIPPSTAHLPFGFREGFLALAAFCFAACLVASGGGMVSDTFAYPPAPTGQSSKTGTAGAGTSDAAAPRDEAVAVESRLKAAFLYNFARFVEWPAEALPGASDPIVICTIGQPDVTRELSLSVAEKKVDGHPILIRESSAALDAKDCQILFVGAGSERAAAALDRGEGAPVLTVGDREGFARDVGIVNFAVRDNRLRFDINTDASDRAHLRLSAKLLLLANVVHDGAERGSPGRRGGNSR
jgi:hypothetical protein